MRIYKVQFESDDFKYNYLVDVEVLGKNRQQAVEMAYEHARQFCDGPAKITDVDEVGRRYFFGKPKVLSVSGEHFRARKHIDNCYLV